MFAGLADGGSDWYSGNWCVSYLRTSFQQVCAVRMICWKRRSAGSTCWRARWDSRWRLQCATTDWPAAVVATGLGGEQRIVDAVRAAAAGRGSELGVLLTTVGWIENHLRRPFGSIWLDPKRGMRRSWPT